LRYCNLKVLNLWVIILQPVTPHLVFWLRSFLSVFMSGKWLIGSFIGCSNDIGITHLPFKIYKIILENTQGSHFTANLFIILCRDLYLAFQHCIK
jgi:hypothetical protein